MTSGPVLFARYAYPPNELGYCGPDAAAELLERAEDGTDSPELRRLARGFEGAWPYLELIAHANGLADPLAPAVVEAYWIGNRLLDTVTPRAFHESLELRFRPRLRASDWSGMDAAPSAGARPHHAFHVFAVYPWVGLLRGGRVEEPLRVLDRCRISWGQVVDVQAGTALVASRPLTWDGVLLGLGEPRLETARLPQPLVAPGRGSAGPDPGSPLRGRWCSLHWDWICDVLDLPRLRALVQHTHNQLDALNAQARPPRGRPLHNRPGLAGLEGAEPVCP